MDTRLVSTVLFVINTFIATAVCDQACEDGSVPKIKIQTAFPCIRIAYETRRETMNKMIKFITTVNEDLETLRNEGCSGFLSNFLVIIIAKRVVIVRVQKL